MLFDFCFSVQRVLALERAVLIKLKLARSITAVLLRSVILPLALCALQGDFLNRSLFLICHTLLLCLGKPKQTLKAFGRNRTADPILTKDVLYHLSYKGKCTQLGRANDKIAIVHCFVNNGQSQTRNYYPLNKISQRSGQTFIPRPRSLPCSILKRGILPVAMHHRAAADMPDPLCIFRNAAIGRELAAACNIHNRL